MLPNPGRWDCGPASTSPKVRPSAYSGPPPPPFSCWMDQGFLRALRPRLPASTHTKLILEHGAQQGYVANNVSQQALCQEDWVMGQAHQCLPYRN